MRATEFEAQEGTEGTSRHPLLSQMGKQLPKRSICPDSSGLDSWPPNATSAWPCLGDDACLGVWNHCRAPALDPGGQVALSSASGV